MPDPNWLLSTLVQSTAAFVAIVAGFIINRLLALSAERNSLQVRIRDKQLELSIKNQQILPLKNRLLVWDAKEFIEDSKVVNLIIETEGNITLQEVVKQIGYKKRTEEELQPFWDEVVDFTRKAVPFVKENYSLLEENIVNLDVQLEKMGIDTSSFRLEFYERILLHLIHENVKRENQYSLNYSTGMILPPNSGSYMIANEIQTNQKIDQYRNIEKDIENCSLEIKSLSIILSDLQSQLNHLGKPKSVTLGVFFLSYFTFGGIVVPVLLLSFPPEKFDASYKFIVILLFFSGLVFFFFYLFKLIRQLADSSKESILSNEFEKSSTS